MRALMARRMPYANATTRAVTIGRAVAMAMVLAGFWDLSFTVLGLFLFIAAQLEQTNVMFHRVLEGVETYSVVHDFESGDVVGVDCES